MSDLRLVPGIGAKKESDLFGLGYHSLEELKGADPDKLYIEDCLRKGYQEDKCVLYAFRCAVAFANDPKPDPDKYRWWFFTDEKQKVDFNNTKKE